CWLGPGNPPTVLLLLQDEATARMLFSLSMDDSCESAMQLLGAWIERWGLPAALRCQRRLLSDETRQPSLEQQLRGGEPGSALARACERLGVDVAVLSPLQARAWLGDRCAVLETLRAELRARAPRSLAEATALLAGVAGETINRLYALRTDGREDYHVPIVDGTDLRRILCVDRVCRVGPNGLVCVGRRQFRLEAGFHPPRGIPSRVVVSEWLDGSFHFLHEGAELPFRESPGAPEGPCPRQPVGGRVAI
ncbi:MAG TPA: hypothetical protein VL359_13535, partial [bacterium]|nr:hypothetical protein [bacterium]